MQFMFILLQVSILWGSTTSARQMDEDATSQLNEVLANEKRDALFDARLPPSAGRIPGHSFGKRDTLFDARLPPSAGRIPGHSFGKRDTLFDARLPPSAGRIPGHSFGKRDALSEASPGKRDE
ncbi:hypothetical protein OS493_005059 [Desmophyllum pertusum]|uniref:Uncharacterized protein n=1 Tax=Desmophyllum pertusum TaxID=174260 RepID=A0A9X0CUI8_9CNID|nr:hypothetical protein OS493_005059 [Desmophyllum pertusum]